MSEETVNCPKKVIRCDKCGEQGEREDPEGRPYFIHCAVCKKDFCWGCFRKHENTNPTLREMYNWSQNESFICAECYDRVKAETELQEGIAQYMEVKKVLVAAEAEMVVAKGLIRKVIQEASK